ncbi:MAG TPA: hypothetical protein PLX06_11440 [Fimbriimonadaceae bacterium]|nr:hypothetical protein [Fimbriimonadaceae bacterium]
MFTLNLGWARSGEPSTYERILWTVPSETKAKRRRMSRFAATVPEKSKRKTGLITQFEQMMAAYADTLIGNMRD